MKQTRLILILFAVTAMFTILFGTAAAQDVDVDSISNEELMVLLQSIMQKLEKDMAADAEKKEPETVETPVPTSEPGVSAAQVTGREPKRFSIYENKKLIIGRMPDSWFIRKKSGDGDDGDDGGSGGGGFHYGGDFYPVYGGSFSPPDVWSVW